MGWVLPVGGLKDAKKDYPCLDYLSYLILDIQCAV